MTTPETVLFSPERWSEFQSRFGEGVKIKYRLKDTEVEEITAECIRHLIEQYRNGKFKEGGSQWGWAWTVAMNKAKDIRKQSKQKCEVSCAWLDSLPGKEERSSTPLLEEVWEERTRLNDATLEITRRMKEGVHSLTKPQQEAFSELIRFREEQFREKSWDERNLLGSVDGSLRDNLSKLDGCYKTNEEHVSKALTTLIAGEILHVIDRPDGDWDDLFFTRCYAPFPVYNFWVAWDLHSKLMCDYKYNRAQWEHRAKRSLQLVDRGMNKVIPLLKNGDPEAFLYLPSLLTAAVLAARCMPNDYHDRHVELESIQTDSPSLRHWLAVPGSFCGFDRTIKELYRGNENPEMFLSSLAWFTDDPLRGYRSASVHCFQGTNPCKAFLPYHEKCPGKFVTNGLKYLELSLSDEPCTTRLGASSMTLGLTELLLKYLHQKVQGPLNKKDTKRLANIKRLVDKPTSFDELKPLKASIPDLIDVLAPEQKNM